MNEILLFIVGILIFSNIIRFFNTANKRNDKIRIKKTIILLVNYWISRPSFYNDNKKECENRLRSLLNRLIK